MSNSTVDRPTDSCNWQRSEDGQDDTDCGGTWELNDGTPPEHGMKFCPYCGKSIIWHDVEPEEPPDPDGECYRGGEAASALAESQAWIQRNLK
jgi:hypothetical protein